MGQDELRALVESCDVEGVGSGHDLGLQMETYGVGNESPTVSFWLPNFVILGSIKINRGARRRKYSQNGWRSSPVGFMTLSDLSPCFYTLHLQCRGL